MVLLQCVPVGVAEGDAELVVGVAKVLAQGLRGEVQAAREPEQALRCGVLVLGEFGADEGLQGRAVEGGGEVAGADFLSPTWGLSMLLASPLNA